MRTLLVLLTVCLPLLAQASDSAYETVKSAKEFAIGHIGVAGTISPAETALRQLIKEKDAVARCRQLTTDATPEGQLYGLLGLSWTDRTAFDAALPKYQKSGKEVTMIGGCIIMQAPVRQVAFNIEKGLYK